MNISHLKYFETLAKRENYTIAAKELFITQPSLSYAISSLEDEIGIKLFEKKGRNIFLTDSGKIFLDEISIGLNNIEAAISRIDSIKKGSGYISIGSLRILTQKFVPKIVHDFINDNKNAEIDINIDTSTGMSKDIIKDIKEKRFDVGFCSFIEDEEDIEFIPVCNQKLVLIAPKNHKILSSNITKLKQIEEYDFIGYKERSGLYYIVREILSKNNIEVNTISRVSEDETAAGMVGAGFGISIVPEMSILNELDLEILDLSDFNFYRKYYMAYSKNNSLLPVVQNFINYVKKYEI